MCIFTSCECMQQSRHPHSTYTEDDGGDLREKRGEFGSRHGTKFGRDDAAAGQSTVDVWTCWLGTRNQGLDLDLRQRKNA